MESGAAVGVAVAVFLISLIGVVVGAIASQQSKPGTKNSDRPAARVVAPEGSAQAVVLVKPGRNEPPIVVGPIEPVIIGPAGQATPAIEKTPRAVVSAERTPAVTVRPAEAALIAPNRREAVVIEPVKRELIRVEAAKPIAVAPAPVPVVGSPPRGAWDERGWTRRRENGRIAYDGHYQVKDCRTGQPRRFRGRIEQRNGTAIPFIADPPPDIKRHPKAPCFTLLQAPWFIVNWYRPAANADEALLYVEKVLDEAINRC